MPSPVHYILILTTLMSAAFVATLRHLASRRNGPTPLILLGYECCT